MFLSATKSRDSFLIISPASWGSPRYARFTREETGVYHSVDILLVCIIVIDILLYYNDIYRGVYFIIGTAGVTREEELGNGEGYPGFSQ